MADTSNFGWTKIAEYDESWFGEIDQLFDDIDADLAIMTCKKITVTFSATPAFNADQGNSFELGALTGNVTSWSITNGKDGQEIAIRWTQDGTGSRTVGGAASSIKLAGGAWTMTSTADKSDILTFRKYGSNWYEVSRSQNMG